MNSAIDTDAHFFGGVTEAVVGLVGTAVDAGLKYADKKQDQKHETNLGRLKLKSDQTVAKIQGKSAAATEKLQAKIAAKQIDASIISEKNKQFLIMAGVGAGALVLVAVIFSLRK